MIKYTFRSFSTPVLTAALAALLLTSGCAVQQTSQLGRMDQDAYVAIDAPDETVGEEYQPIDDGQPLTKLELAAFESTGELDVNLSMEEKQIVELHFKHYVHANRGTVERFLKRGELYLPFLKREFREAGLPEELAYLAFIESGFNPNAVSRAGAGGMWQFMPYTGKKYGLTQDRWHDERRDPFKATRSAIAYLSKLHEYFDGDWHLAIAAYNAGEGKIGRALAGTDSKTFFEICRNNDKLAYKAQLRQETQQYLPRLLAVTKIMRNLESLGFEAPDPNKALHVVSVKVPAGVDLRRFAREINIDWQRFTGLNPAYRRTISPPHAATTAYVPGGKHKDAMAWLARKDAALYAGWRDYRVRTGDSMGKIAHRTGVSTALLRQANGRGNNSLRIGEYLLVPGSTRAAKSAMAKVEPASAPVIARNRDGAPKTGFKGVHAIVAGDTLFALAQSWGTSIDDICELNNISPSSSLRLGQKVYIPSGRTMLTAARPAEETPAAKPAVSLVASARKGPGRYVAVKDGDTLSALARNNDCSVADICKANNITPRTRLQIGMELLILPGAASAQAASVPKADQVKARTKAMATASGVGGSVVVQAGDTLFSIARANNTTVAAIAKRNGISPTGTLRLGQVIQLP